jgi:hypothetical protein
MTLPVLTAGARYCFRRIQRHGRMGADRFTAAVEATFDLLS